MKSIHIAAIFAVFNTACALPAFAHEGHDHGAPPPPISAASAPRAQALSDAFELVAIARDGRLSIYVDHFATNEPASDLAIEVETPAGPRTPIRWLCATSPTGFCARVC